MCALQNILMEFDPETLERKAFFTYTQVNGDFKGMMAPAHTQYDHATKELLGFTLEFGRKNVYKVFSIPDDNPKGSLLAKFEGTNGIEYTILLWHL